MKFAFRTAPIEGFQWFENGDHPEDHVGEEVLDLVAALNKYPELLDGRKTVVFPDDSPTYLRLEGAVVRYFRHPEYPGEEIDPVCGKTWHDHGWLDNGGEGETVCPGDWVMTIDSGYTVLDDKNRQLYFENSEEN